MRKILRAPNLSVHATAVRVPVLVGHTVSLAMSLANPASPQDARRVVRVVSRACKCSTNRGPENIRRRSRPRESTTCWSGVFVRVPFLKNGLAAFASGDNLRKGNALNAIQVAEILFGLVR